MDKYFQCTLLEEEYANAEGIFLTEEKEQLKLIAERLCGMFPSKCNPFCFGIGTRRVVNLEPTPQLELILKHIRLSEMPAGQPEFYQQECQEMLETAARPLEHLSDLPNARDVCEQHENALKSGTVVCADHTVLASIKEGDGWFVLGLKFEHIKTHQDNALAVAFLAGIAETIFAMDESNEYLRKARAGFMASCQYWKAQPPVEQVKMWLRDDGFINFVQAHYERKGPRNFFG